MWPPGYSATNNIATFEPRHYDPRNQAVVDPATGRILSGPRYNGIILPGNGFPSSASNLAVYNDPAVKALFVGAPLGFAQTHKNGFAPPGGAAHPGNGKTVFKGSAGAFHHPRTPD